MTIKAFAFFSQNCKGGAQVKNNPSLYCVRPYVWSPIAQKILRINKGITKWGMGPAPRLFIFCSPPVPCFSNVSSLQDLDRVRAIHALCFLLLELWSCLPISHSVSGRHTSFLKLQGLPSLLWQNSLLILQRPLGFRHTPHLHNRTLCTVETKSPSSTQRTLHRKDHYHWSINGAGRETVKGLRCLPWITLTPIPSLVHGASNALNTEQKYNSWA